MEPIQRVMDSAIGKLYLVASDGGLQGIYWKDKGFAASSGASAATTILDRTELQLTEYLDGRRQEFDLPLDIKGTPFQMRVWERLRQIPYGATKSYKDIATELNDANACRAVGTANGRNPFSIVIPCHRVVNAGGALGGYAGGLDIKSRLLDLEQHGRLL